MPFPSPFLAGVDGCRGGWVVALLDTRTRTLSVRVVPSFAAVLALPEAPAVICADVPIGLLDASQAGGRTCDPAARKLLGSRASSVFSPPSRAALAAFRAGCDYAAVSQANKGGREDAPGLSRQAFAIVPKIAEVDDVVTSALQARVREVHPELCFTEANGGKPLVHGKKRSKGRVERVQLLERVGYPGALGLLGPGHSGDAKPDDLLDACIACWTAERVAAGTATCLPAMPPRDTRELRMEIWR